jgi:hypothetical protein
MHKVFEAPRRDVLSFMLGDSMRIALVGVVGLELGWTRIL